MKMDSIHLIAELPGQIWLVTNYLQKLYFNHFIPYKYPPAIGSLLYPAFGLFTWWEAATNNDTHLFQQL